MSQKAPDCALYSPPPQASWERRHLAGIRGYRPASGRAKRKPRNSASATPAAWKAALLATIFCDPLSGRGGAAGGIPSTLLLAMSPFKHWLFMDSGLLTIRDRHDRRFWSAAATNNLKPRPKFAVPDGTTGFAVGHLPAAALDSATSLLPAPAFRPRESAVAAARVEPGTQVPGKRMDIPCRRGSMQTRRFAGALQKGSRG